MYINRCGTCFLCRLTNQKGVNHGSEEEGKEIVKEEKEGIEEEKKIVAVVEAVNMV